MNIQKQSRIGAGKLSRDKSFYNWTMMNVVKKQTVVGKDVRKLETLH